MRLGHVRLNVSRTAALINQIDQLACLTGWQIFGMRGAGCDKQLLQAIGNVY